MIPSVKVAQKTSTPAPTPATDSKTAKTYTVKKGDSPMKIAREHNCTYEELMKLNGIDDVLVRYAKCCNPLPGDDILGFITRGRGLTIHRRGCTKAFDTDPERRVEISWDAKAKINRSVQLRVVTANRPGILATVGHTFSTQGINISEANCRASDDGRAVNVFTFVCQDLAQLKTVMRALQKVQGVVEVERA